MIANFCAFLQFNFNVTENNNKKKNFYLLINNAESTGTHPDFNTGLVYLLYKTHNIHNGKIIKYTAIMIQDIQ